MSGSIFDSDEALAASDVAEAFLTYRDSGLRLPPLPMDLADTLREIDDWLYATDEGDLSDRRAFLTAAADPAAPDAIAFGHFGRGMTGWFLGYRLVYGAVAVFVRQRYGSPFSDRAAETEAANGAMDKVETLLSLRAKAEEDGTLQPGQRLVVVLDDDEGSGWQLLGPDGTAWFDDRAPLDKAIAALGGG